ncbi:MAG TPA: ABC transporter permease, partial [Treponemataceae bacterium]|nr:ABC transporter permease [Treponemataceae bacterium]
AGFFMWIIQNPGMADTLGLLGTKAKFAFGEQAADWPSFLAFIVQMAGIGGLIMSAVVVTYVYGREYAEGTAKNLLALPIPRRSFVFAKLLVSAFWFLSLSLTLFISSFIAGWAIGLTGLTAAIVINTGIKILVLTLLCMGCSTLVSWVAVINQGYFGPLGYAIFTLMIAMIFGNTGWGPWIPWSIVGLYSGAAGPETGLSLVSYIIIAGTFLLGLALTMHHEVFADNSQ